MKKINDKQINEAVAVLKRGGVVLFPTETAYGLAVDATNNRAVVKLQKLKGRESEKTFPLIVASRAMADRYAHPHCLGHRLMKEYWPGPLTLVMEARKTTDLAKSLIKSDGTIAVRASSFSVASLLSKKLRAPITSTSANIAGGNTSYSVDEVDLAVDYVLDAGKLPKKKPSTIAIITDGNIEILRNGSIKPRDPKKR